MVEPVPDKVFLFYCAVWTVLKFCQNPQQGLSIKSKDYSVHSSKNIQTNLLDIHSVHRVVGNFQNSSDRILGPQHHSLLKPHELLSMLILNMQDHCHGPLGQILVG